MPGRENNGQFAIGPLWDKAKGSVHGHSLALMNSQRIAMRDMRVRLEWDYHLSTRVNLDCHHVLRQI
jgi:hypothetical protein